MVPIIIGVNYFNNLLIIIFLNSLPSHKTYIFVCQYGGLTFLVCIVLCEERFREKCCILIGSEGLNRGRLVWFYRKILRTSLAEHVSNGKVLGTTETKSTF